MFGTRPGSGIGLQSFCIHLASSRRFAAQCYTFKQFNGFKARIAASPAGLRTAAPIWKRVF